MAWDLWLGMSVWLGIVGLRSLVRDGGLELFGLRSLQPIASPDRMDGLRAVAWDSWPGILGVGLSAGDCVAWELRCGIVVDWGLWA